MLSVTHTRTHTQVLSDPILVRRGPHSGWVGGGGGLRETKFVEHGHGIAPRPGADGGPGLPERPCVAVYAYTSVLSLSRSLAGARAFSLEIEALVSKETYYSVKRDLL